MLSRKRTATVKYDAGLDIVGFLGRWKMEIGLIIKAFDWCPASLNKP